MKRFFILCLTIIVAIASFVLVGCSKDKDVADSNIVYYYSRNDEIVTDNEGNPIVIKTIKKGEKVEGISDQFLNEFSQATRGYTAKQYKVLKNYKDQSTIYVVIDIEVKRYSIQYDYNGGTMTSFAKTFYTLNDSFNFLETASATKEGYVHIGWAESPDATEEDIIESTEDLFDNPRSLKLYAIYVPAE